MRPDSSDCSKLVSLAVHELRTPVSVAAGYVRMVLQLRGQALDEETRKYLGEAAGSCAKLSELLAELGELSKLMAGEVPLRADPVAVFALAAEVADSARDEAAPGVRMDVSGVDPAVRVTGDAGRLRTSLASIVAAALRERIHPGVLRVECRSTRSRGGRTAVIAVGEVESARALASLPPSRWDPFDAWRGGVGFALPMAVHIITAHRGWMGSLPPAPQRAAVAVALPVQE